MSKMSWTEEEVDFLRKAYQTGLSLKEMGYFLKRSVTAVNKALYRFSIRKKEIRLKKPKDSSGEVRHEIMQSIMETSKKREQNLACLRIEDFEKKKHLTRETFSDYPNRKDLSPHGHLSEIFQDETLFEEGTYSDFSLVCGRVKKKKILYRHPEKFVFFEDVLRWLAHRDFRIEKIHQEFFLEDSFQASLPLYKITMPFYEKETPHSFKTEAQLLLFANKIRLKEALPLFYVFNITVE
ncbi:MAG TPA: hypothetical protein PLY23_08930 [Alphaproteobacteria bacterium]|nr:hypothetical protein [Alphaproteobacteria bacterium]HQS94739.1 hypothetical protein [Alphaproteobacteria bacterium]